MASIKYRISEDIMIYIYENDVIKIIDEANIVKQEVYLSKEELLSIVDKVKLNEI